MADQTLWVGYTNTIGISNSATGDPSPTYVVHESGQGTVTFTPRSPVTAVTGVDVKNKSGNGGTSMGWTTTAVGTDGMSITDPGEAAGTTLYYAVSVTRSGFTGTDTLDPLWQND
jgi:hypothetical protein